MPLIDGCEVWARRADGVAPGLATRGRAAAFRAQAGSERTLPRPGALGRQAPGAPGEAPQDPTESLLFLF